MSLSESSSNFSGFSVSNGLDYDLQRQIFPDPNLKNIRADVQGERNCGILSFWTVKHHHRRRRSGQQPKGRAPLPAVTAIIDDKPSVNDVPQSTVISGSLELVECERPFVDGDDSVLTPVLVDAEVSKSNVPVAANRLFSKAPKLNKKGTAGTLTTSSSSSTRRRASAVVARSSRSKDSSLPTSPRPFVLAFRPAPALAHAQGSLLTHATEVIDSLNRQRNIRWAL
ncbi:hypothetical protein FA15DRAFT_710373 [Coprinopsis marcescibilis]|uniref:Uncharacterized protein n=1 Tax=Coprinopsis marcescibilis TaxID=230819 RepID=A0A5C3KD57_COPMA|nr:hypothetical protein FA15DRAFT_710373 [Coprinopsis marcescibilis]